MKLWFLGWMIGWGALCDGLVRILSLGFLRPIWMFTAIARYETAFWKRLKEEVKQ